MAISARQIERQNFIIGKQLQKMEANQQFTLFQKNPDKYDEFLILLHPQTGHFAKQKHVLELKTIYGNDSHKYYFPYSPPSVRFLTQIYHTNISREGSICLDIFKDPSKWSAQNTIETVMNYIIALLDSPNTSSAFNLEPSKHWTIGEKNYKIYKSENKKASVKEDMIAETRIFADYVKTADEIASKNNLEQWAEYFPCLLDLSKMNMS